jgi:MFS family permease
MGFAGGLICVVLYALLKNLGAEIIFADYVSGGNNLPLAIGLYFVSIGLFCCGVIGDKPKERLRDLPNLFKHSGRLVSDFYYEHGKVVYVNMAALCAASTTLVLVLGAQLNGLTIAGIFAILGFGSFGKHLKNIYPVLLGAILAVLINRWDPGANGNITTILFATGLAPIAGQYGVLWGAVAGFLHANIAAHAAYISGGMNLYSNGFSAGFVAMFLLPLITTFKKEDAK